MPVVDSIDRPAAGANRRKEYVVQRFTGIDSNDDPVALKENFSPDTLNTVLDLVGSIQTRRGYTKVLTTSLASPISGIKPFYKSDGTKQLTYGSGTNLYRYDNAGGSVSIGSGYTNGAQWDMDVYQDQLFACNGNQPAQIWNGTTMSTLSAGLTPSLLRVHKNRVWCVQPSQPSTLYFSDAGQPSSFPAGNFININTNDSQVITALAVLLDSLIVFKTDSIWVITGEPLGSGNSTVIGNLNLRRANSDVGCVAFRTVCQVESSLLFMSRSGIYLFENYQSRRVSDDINSTFTNINPNALANSWAVYSPNDKKYLLGYATLGTNTPQNVICYDLVVNRFTLWDDYPGSCATVYRFNNQDSVVFGDPVKGIIYQAFQGYADIAGYNGTLTGAGLTTLTDATAAWTTNQFVDCKVQVGLGTSAATQGVVVSNTATTLTIGSWSNGTPSAGTAYTIGGFSSYWKSKIFDFEAPQLSKRYKYLNIFTDSENNYNLQVGASLDFAPVSFNLTPLSLSAGSLAWDQSGVNWDVVGNYWDSRASLFKRSSLPGPQGRFIQVMFGNFNGNQPWRVFRYSISFRPKKARPT